jgi:histidine decarboxylase
LEKNYRKKLIVFSQDAHFSVEKVAKMSGEPYVKVQTKGDGTMDLDDFSKVISIGKRCGAEDLVILATLGTTFKGACDDIPSIIDHAEELYSRGNIFMHLDAAFTGGFWHLDDNAVKYRLGEDFDSFSVSGHKFYGGFIAGCFFTLESTNIRSTKVGYLGLEDKIASGSRNGYPPIMWTARLKQFDWKLEYLQSRENLMYFEKRLKDCGVPCFSHPISLITIFPEPSSAVCDYFQLATMDNWAHVCMVPHITN